ncbi:hypothetical protein T4D_14080 [Trichinella pseudospiralis]|uniref:Uncharacterized protein n=1 Tax=Trichinella pseudospiralis TaxID=6337 RepID=A0A0V1F7U3_TRIPS|nr:hypothetical protein T4D_14080 [Trichinella pseudospiralis]
MGGAWVIELLSDSCHMTDATFSMTLVRLLFFTYAFLLHFMCLHQPPPTGSQAGQSVELSLKLMIGLEFLNKECELRQDEIKIRILQMCQFCLGMLLINTSHLAVGFSASARYVAQGGATLPNIITQLDTIFNIIRIIHSSDSKLKPIQLYHVQACPLLAW